MRSKRPVSDYDSDEMEECSDAYVDFVMEQYENPQMKLYGLGALHEFDMLYSIDKVDMSIFQPRCENVSTFTMKADDLKAWGENVLKEKAAMAYKGEGEYKPVEWCTFCRAAVKCRARVRRS